MPTLVVDDPTTVLENGATQLSICFASGSPWKMALAIFPRLLSFVAMYLQQN